MPDPLSIGTGILAIIGSANALASTIKKLYRVRYAQTAIALLENEMTALRSYVESVNKLLGMSNGSQQNNAFQHLPIERYLETARTKIDQVNSFLDQKLLNDTPQRKIKKSVWLKWETELNRLNQELRDARMEIGTCLNFLNA